MATTYNNFIKKEIDKNNRLPTNPQSLCWFSRAIKFIMGLLKTAVKIRKLNTETMEDDMEFGSFLCKAIRGRTKNIKINKFIVSDCNIFVSTISSICPSMIL